MNRLAWKAPIFFVIATSIYASADSLNIFLIPNNGSGDNFGFVQQVNGTTINLSGGLPFRFFSDQGFAPGSAFGGTASAFLSGGTIQVGKNVFDLGFNGPGTLFVSSFTFPANGTSFSIQVQAVFSVQAFYFDVNGQVQRITINGSAHGIITFNYDPVSGLYFAPSNTPTVLTSVPEPGTFGLMAMGLPGILVASRRTFKRRRGCRWQPVTVSLRN